MIGGASATFQWLQAACLSLLANISINKILCELQVYFTKGKNSHFIPLNRLIESSILAEMRIFLMADVLDYPFRDKKQSLTPFKFLSCTKLLEKKINDALE